MAVIRSFQSETPPTLEVEEARLSGCKGDMAAEDGDFGLILADLKSTCFLLTCSEDPEGKDPMVGENGGGAAPSSDEAAGEEGASVSRVLPRDVNSAGVLKDKEKAADSMPPPPARKDVVLALRAPSAVLATQPKSRKRKLAKSGDGENSLSLKNFHRSQFVSLIDGMIGECGSETSRLSGELVELQGRWSETKAMLTAVKDSHSESVEARARRGIQEATDALRAEFQARLAKISASLGSPECIRSRYLALATIEGGMAVVRSFQSETPPTLEAEEARLSGCKGDMVAENGDFSLVLADLKSVCFLPTCSEDPEGKDPMVGENGVGAAPGSDEAAGEEGAPVSRVLPRDVNSAGDKEKAADSMPPPPARKDVVLALRAPSAVLATQPKSRKRKLAKSGDGENSQRGGSSLASGLRGKFISLIDGMIGECDSETSRLSGELVELQGRWSETEAMFTAVKDSQTAKVSKLEVAIGELERDLGKTASSLLKEKKARKAKSSEVRRLQRQIESDAGLARRGIQEATDALRAEFQARLAKISASQGSLECIRSRDLALATIEGGMVVVRSFQRETPPTLEAEEARLPGCKGDMAAENGDFGLVLADLKSTCFLPMKRGKTRWSEKTEVARLQARTRQRVKRGHNRIALFMSLRIVGRKVMSCRLISFFDCEMFHSRPVSRVLPRDVNSAGVYSRFKDCAVTNRLSFFLSRFLPDSCRCKVRDSAIILARSLRSDRAGRALGRYIATELRLELGRYVATELGLEFGRYVATERDGRSVDV
ncbi:hypothetical protein F2Q68_00039983 [Brassica cretica]|uniref:Uncharacterized protein n=1 Tax=Brassica cretica TaxID=69181 RepID=A0A8S9MHP0_BRACR|nr:hypothetical protein F2Q68_00039983 [Brassica cretica]